MNKDFHCLLIVKNIIHWKIWLLCLILYFMDTIIYSNTMFLIKIILHLATTILRKVK